MNLKELQKEIPYKWRIQSYSQNKPFASCVAYIDARDVMDLLDEVAQPENWQNDYKMVGDRFMAGIAIKIEGEWVWKWDTGSESNTEADKGQVSDSFKRAAVKWGIGRFLYSKGVTYVKTNEILKKEGGRPINYPYVIDETGKRVHDLSTYINK